MERFIDMYQIYGAFEKNQTQRNSTTVEPERTEDGLLVCYVRGLMTDTYYKFRIYAVNEFDYPNNMMNQTQ